MSTFLRKHFSWVPPPVHGSRTNVTLLVVRTAYCNVKLLSACLCKLHCCRGTLYQLEHKRKSGTEFVAKVTKTLYTKCIGRKIAFLVRPSIFLVVISGDLILFYEYRYVVYFHILLRKTFEGLFISSVMFFTEFNFIGLINILATSVI